MIPALNLYKFVVYEIGLAKKPKWVSVLTRILAKTQPFKNFKTRYTSVPIDISCLKFSQIDAWRPGVKLALLSYSLFPNSEPQFIINTKHCTQDCLLLQI